MHEALAQKLGGRAADLGNISVDGSYRTSVNARKFGTVAGYNRQIGRYHDAELLHGPQHANQKLIASGYERGRPIGSTERIERFTIGIVRGKAMRG